MKHKKKMVAGAIAIMIGAMSCMTAMAAARSAETCPVEGCGYYSDMYSVVGYTRNDTGTRTCVHGLSGVDVYYTCLEKREFYCPDHDAWTRWVVTGALWECEGH